MKTATPGGALENVPTQCERVGGFLNDRLTQCGGTLHRSTRERSCPTWKQRYILLELCSRFTWWRQPGGRKTLTPTFVRYPMREDRPIKRRIDALCSGGERASVRTHRYHARCEAPRSAATAAALCCCRRSIGFLMRRRQRLSRRRSFSNESSGCTRATSRTAA